MTLSVPPIATITEASPVAFGPRSGSIILEKTGGLGGELLDAKGKTPYRRPTPADDTADGDVATWGTDNRLPQQMLADIERTTVLSAGIDAKARIAVGRGPVPMILKSVAADGTEELEYANSPEIRDWLDLNDAFTYSYAGLKDQIGLGNRFSQLLIDKQGKLAGFRRHDAAECRFSKKDKNGRSSYVYLSGNWEEFEDMKTASEHVAKIPLLDREAPHVDILNVKGPGVFMMADNYPLMGRQYYAPAPWYTALKWVRIAQSIPDLKKALFDNSMTIKYVVEIHEEYWAKQYPQWAGFTPEEKQKKRKDVYQAIDEHLVGTKNAGKSIYNPVWKDGMGGSVKGLTITALPDNMKEGKLLPDGAAASTEILFALMINPARVGVDAPGGGAVRTAGSGSNIRESYLVQVMMLEAERQMNNKIFRIAKALNGWDPAIVLRYPNQILTTLNTGANTASVA